MVMRVTIYVILIVIIFVADGVAIDSAEYVIISHPNFLDAIQPLLQWREQQGFSCLIKNIDDICTEYPSNEGDDYSIKAYLYDLFFQGDIVPKYVLLVGDADPTGENDFLSTHYISTMYSHDYSDLYVSQDGWFSMLEGDDCIPDLSVGRISVCSSEDVTNYIQKVINYETNHLVYPQYSYFLFISNDFSTNDWFSSMLRKVVQDIYENLIPSCYEHEEYFYLDYIYKPEDYLRSLVLQHINDGVFIVNFLGTECFDTNLDLSGIGVFINTEYLGLMDNDHRYFIFVCPTCVTANFCQPEVERPLETLLWEGNKAAVGAIGVPDGLGRTQYTYPYSQAIYSNLYGETYLDNINIFGVLLDKIKKYILYHDNYCFRPHGLLTTLLGDPALVLDIPVYGSITGEIVLDHDVYVTGDIKISSGATLTIEPGVTINFAPNRDDNNLGINPDKCEIIVSGGTLIVNGTEREPVTFHCREESGWGGVLVQYDGTCNLTHTRIRNAVDGVRCAPGSGIHYQNLTMDECEIKNSYMAGISLYYTDANISDTVIYGGNNEGIRIQPHCDVVLSNCEIYDNADQGIYNMGSDVTMTGCSVYNNQQEGVIDNNDGNIVLNDCTIHHNSKEGVYVDSGSVEISGGGVHHNSETGIYIDGVNSPQITGCSVNNNGGRGIEILNSSTGYVYNCSVLNNSSIGICVDNSPYTDIEECHIWGNELIGLRYKDSQGGGPTGLGSELSGMGTLSYLGSISNNDFKCGPVGMGSEDGFATLSDMEKDFDRSGIEKNILDNPDVSEANVLAILCDNSTPTIIGNEIEGYDIGIELFDHTGEVSGNTIENCPVEAILINHGDEIDIQGNTIENCGIGIQLVDDSGPTGLGGSGLIKTKQRDEEIEVSKEKLLNSSRKDLNNFNSSLVNPLESESLSIERLENPTEVNIVGNNISYCSGSGIIYRDWATGEIAENILVNIESDGIYSNAGVVTVRDNEVYWEGSSGSLEPYSGIIIEDATNVEISGNQIRYLSGDGIKIVNVINSNVSDNTVQDCEEVGILFNNTSGNVRKNIVEGNSIGIKVTGFTVPNLGEEGLMLPPDIGRNIIRGNDDWELYLDSSTPLLAEGNCWGTLDLVEIDGLIHDDDELPLTGEVDFEPIGISGMLSSSGPSGGNFVCDFSEEPLYVFGDTIVPIDCNLTLMAGSEVLFCPRIEMENYGEKEGYNELIVLGNIITLGSEESPVVMKGVGVIPDEPEWGGMIIGDNVGQNPSESTDLDWLEMVGFDSGGLCIRSRDFSVSDCSFKDGSGYGIRIEGDASPSIDNITIEGLVAEATTPFGDGALEIRGYSTPTVRDSLIINNEIVGVLIDDSASPDLGSISNYGNNDIHRNGLGFDTHYNLINKNASELDVIGNSWGFTSSQSIEDTIGDSEFSGGDVTFEPYEFMNGHIDSDTILSGSEALFTGDVFIDPGYSLEVSSGCEVKFSVGEDDYRGGGGMDDNKCEMVVSGTLNVTEIQGDLLTISCNSVDRVPGGWYGIRVTDDYWDASCQPDIDVDIDYCEILDSVNGLTINKNKKNSDIDVQLTNFSIQGFSQTGVRLENGGFDLSLNPADLDWGWIEGEGQYSLYNNTPLQYSAERIWWGTTVESEIDALIYDDDETGGSCGAIDFIPYLTAPPLTAYMSASFEKKHEEMLEDVSVQKELGESLVNREVVVLKSLSSGIVSSVKTIGGKTSIDEIEGVYKSTGRSKLQHVTGLLEVELEAPVWGEARVKVYDIAGRYLGSINMTIEEGKFLWDGKVEGNSLSSGVYILSIDLLGEDIHNVRVVVPGNN